MGICLFTCRFCSQDYAARSQNFTAHCGTKACFRKYQNEMRKRVWRDRASKVKQRGFSFDAAGNLVDKFGDVHPKSSFEERFWAKTERRIGECWLWQGTMSNRGYGFFTIRDQKFLAHRIAYGLTYGTVPRDLPLDHLCRNPRCINPTHLEAVTTQENFLRSRAIAVMKAKAAARTHCTNGLHLWVPENVYKYPSGVLTCRLCRKASWDRFAAARKVG